MKEKILNEVKQQFSPCNQGDKINAELVESLREQIENLQSEICFLREEMKEHEKAPFHEQNMPESSQEQSTDPSNRGASKDYHTNSIPIPSMKHPTSFAVNYKNDTNIMVERDGSIVCQQNSQEPETKKPKQS